MEKFWKLIPFQPNQTCTEKKDGIQFGYINSHILGIWLWDYRNYNKYLLTNVGGYLDFAHEYRLFVKFYWAIASGDDAILTQF